MKANERVLNLRRFPEDLYWKLKELSAYRRVSVKDLVINILREHIGSAKEFKQK